MLGRTKPSVKDTVFFAAVALLLEVCSWYSAPMELCSTDSLLQLCCWSFSPELCSLLEKVFRRPNWPEAALLEFCFMMGNL
jgi:hypothetical protein